MKKETKIDFVIPWVDGNDLTIQKKKEQYLSKEEIFTRQASKSRYRDWGFLKYWFRSVEANAPWVNKIYLITDNQVPDFINKNCNKLVIVDHKDYIPKEFLPTFSANTIELNVHRIKDLSEYFVYFNDDTFLNKPINKSFFFKHFLPCYKYVERKKKNHFLNYMDFITANDMAVVNSHLSRKDILRHPFKLFNLRYGKSCIKNIFNIFSSSFNYFEDDHMPSPFLKSTFLEVWELEKEKCSSTCNNKVRKNKDLNQYVFRYYDLARGNFAPAARKYGGYYLVDKTNIDSAIDNILHSKNEMVCLNDNEMLKDSDFEFLSSQIIKTLELRYSKKSSFEN